MVNEKETMLNVALGVYQIRQLETEVVCMCGVRLCVCGMEGVEEVRLGGGVGVYKGCLGMGV